MSDADIEQLAVFMGHTSSVHRGSYRLSNNVFQMAKLSKLLLLMEKGEAANYKGKNLAEIELDMDENLLNDSQWHDEDDEFIYDEESEMNEGIAETKFHSEKSNMEHGLQGNNGHAVIIKDQQQMTKKRVLVPWTEQQKSVTRAFFSKHIQTSKPPKRNECEELIKHHPQLFINKSWDKISVCTKRI